MVGRVEVQAVDQVFRENLGVPTEKTEETEAHGEHETPLQRLEEGDGAEAFVWGWDGHAGRLGLMR
jgi:hypothetical protein